MEELLHQMKSNFKLFCEKITKNEDLFSRTSKEIEDLEKGIHYQEYTDEYADDREDIHNLPVPEYGDTGWVDRKDLNIQLKKLKNNNVISFIGDAGAGKTALAVKNVMSTFMVILKMTLRHLFIIPLRLRNFLKEK